MTSPGTRAYRPLLCAADVPLIVAIVGVGSPRALPPPIAEHLPIGPALPKNPLRDVASSLAVQPLCR